MMFLPLLRLRSLIALVALIVVGMALLHPDAEAAPGDPVPATTPEQAQADPVWADLGIAEVGSVIPEEWRSGAGSYWDTPPSVGTPGEIAPQFTGRARALAGIKHTFGGADISSVTIDASTWTVSGFVPGNPAPPPGVEDCPPDDTTCVIARTPGGRVNGGGTVELDVDPIMWLAGKFGEGAQTIFGWALNDAANAANPDLSAGWFLTAWGRSYGIGSIVLAFLLAFRIGGGVRRGETGQDWAADLFIAVAGFFVAATLGPLIGQLLINVSTGFASNVVNGPGGITGAFQTMIDATARTTSGDGSSVGASIIAFVIAIVVCVASAVCLVVIVASLSLIYLSGALFLIAFAWVIIKRFRAGAFRAARVFAVMVAAKPALFVVLALATDIVTSTVTETTGSIPEDAVTLIVGSIVMLIAGAAPFLVWNYVGVPDGGQHSAPGGGLNMLLLRGGSRAVKGRR
jgi:hypothetical protein